MTFAAFTANATRRRLDERTAHDWFRTLLAHDAGVVGRPRDARGGADAPVAVEQRQRPAVERRREDEAGAALDVVGADRDAGGAQQAAVGERVDVERAALAARDVGRRRPERDVLRGEVGVQAPDRAVAVGPIDRQLRLAPGGEPDTPAARREADVMDEERRVDGAQRAAAAPAR